MKGKKQQQAKASAPKHSGSPTPQEHWEIKTGLLRGNNKNPNDVYFAKPPTEWPRPHKKINECDY